MGNCYMPQGKVQEALLAAQPALASSILDLTVKHPIWLSEMWQLEAFPLGQGTTLQQIISRGQMPQIERGFSQWAKQTPNTGCDPCEGPNCGYNWTTFGGLGLQKKAVEMLRREFRSQEYCIHEIQTTAHFREMFSLIVQNLWRQISFFKEINIGQNVLTSLAKKYVVDSDGAKANTANPYAYRTVGSSTRLSMLNIEILEFFYEWMRRIPDAIPYDVSDGQPIFALECSQQLLARLYRDDPELRQDVRFSGLANDLVTRYNFMKTIRGMFLPAPILYPRRFNIVSGEAVEVLPFVNDVPIDVGVYTAFNPAYEAATHEEVIIHGKWPFKLYYMPVLETLGEGTSFGPEVEFFNNWMWVNIQTEQDPMRRVGRFVTSASVGISQQFSEGIFAILVERPRPSIMGSWLPAPVCPPEDPECDNSVPDVGCPEPAILGSYVSPVNGNVILTLATPTTADEADEVTFGIDTGGFLVGTVVAVSSDGLAVEVTFPNGTDLGLCDHFTFVFCNSELACSSTVVSYNTNCSDSTRIDLILEQPIAAYTAADSVRIFYGNDPTTAVTATVVSVDFTTNTWVVDIGGTAFCDQVGGVLSICVPTATVARCPGCPEDPTFEPCDSDCGVTPLT